MQNHPCSIHTKTTSLGAGRQDKKGEKITTQTLFLMGMRIRTDDDDTGCHAVPDLLSPFKPETGPPNFFNLKVSWELAPNT
jgi:hypothetical protein